MRTFSYMIVLTGSGKVTLHRVTLPDKRTFVAFTKALNRQMFGRAVAIPKLEK